MLVGFVIDLFAFAAVNGFLTAVWVLTGDGTASDVSRIATHIASDPALATKLHFWPVWPILGWGMLLVIHAGVVIGTLGFGRRARRHRRELARQAAAAAVQLTRKSAEAVAAKHRPPAPVGPRRRWVTVMFTDVADSTGLNESLGDEEWSRVLGQHRQFIRASFEGCGGEVVGTQGDGFLGRFSQPTDAVQCAVDIQRELHQVREAAGGFPLRVRIGVHAGDAMEDDGDLIGRVVNLAARVTSEAHPGEILVTEPVADNLDGAFGVEDRGLRELRGVPQPRHLLAVRWAPD